MVWERHNNNRRKIKESDFMDWNYLIKLLIILNKGLIVSLKIFILTLIFSVPFGIAVSRCAMTKNKIVKCITKIYILVMRGTPLLLQIICIYFAPYYISGISYNRFIAVIIAFVLNYSAYFGEIFRGGIESIPIGQWEASFTLGFSKIQTFLLIILPQVIKRVLQALSNEIITLVRDTSLAQVIGISELFSLAQKQANYKFSIIPLLIAGVIYLIISIILTMFFSFTEKKLEYYK